MTHTTLSTLPLCFVLASIEGSLCGMYYPKTFPMFIVTSRFANHIEEPEDLEDYEEEDGWRENVEEPTYERYSGSSTQDEMGYSDDDIDTIFDGDPLAYWNID